MGDQNNSVRRATFSEDLLNDDPFKKSGFTCEIENHVVPAHGPTDTLHHMDRLRCQRTEGENSFEYDALRTITTSSRTPSFGESAMFKWEGKIFADGKWLNVKVIEHSLESTNPIAFPKEEGQVDGVVNHGDRIMIESSPGQWETYVRVIRGWDYYSANNLPPRIVSDEEAPPLLNHIEAAYYAALTAVGL